MLFGLLGFLLARGWFARRLIWAVTALAVGLFYFGELLILFNIFEPGISWSSHLWGFTGGIALAWWMYGRTAEPKQPAMT